MKANSLPFLLLLILISFNGNAENQQSHSNSCGSRALSQLLSGIDDKNISEQDVFNVIRPLSGDEDDYDIGELRDAAGKLGFAAMDEALATDVLPNLREPVLLLIDITTKLSHFVVLKGIRSGKDTNGTAYLFDPATGYDIQVPYKTLIERSIDSEHPKFQFIRVAYFPEKLKKSLYLPESESDIQDKYHTEAEANSLAMGNSSKKGQLTVGYGFVSSLGNNKINGLTRNLNNFNHKIHAQYGLDKNSEIGGSIEYVDNTEIISFGNEYKENFNYTNRLYEAYLSQSFKLNKLDDTGKTNLNVSLTGSYAEKNNIFGAYLSVTGVKNTEYAQFSLGGSIGREFTYDRLTRSLLPEYLSYSGFIGASRQLTNDYFPILNDFVGAVNFRVSQGQNENKNTVGTFQRTYSASTSLKYALTRVIQIEPSFTYSFGATETFSFGMDISYVGGW